MRVSSLIATLCCLCLIVGCGREAEPTTASQYISRGCARMERGELQDAILDFDQAVQLEATNPITYMYRADAWRKMNQLDKAIADLHKATELDPVNVGYRYDLGNFYDANKQYREAAEQFTHCLQMDPLDYDAANNLGSAYLKMHEYDKAIASYSNAIEIDPDRGFAWHNRAKIKCDQFGDHAGAIEDYNKAIELIPMIGHPLTGRANTYFRLKRYNDAVLDFEKALTLEYKAWMPRDFAIFLSTCPDEKHRNGNRAVALVLESMDAYTDKSVVDWTFHEAMALAEAECGNFERAVQEQKIVMKKLREAPNQDEKAIKIAEEKLELFLKNQPYRQPE